MYSFSVAIATEEVALQCIVKPSICVYKRTFLVNQLYSLIDFHHQSLFSLVDFPFESIFQVNQLSMSLAPVIATFKTFCLVSY